MNRRNLFLGLALAASVAAAFAQTRTLSSREFFYVGGKYTGAPGHEVMIGQMYVEVLRPQRVTHPYPLVFFHGNWQTATNWLGTPDGRTGWADYFLGQGYVVYLIDQPARGRSAWHASANGPLSGLPIADIEQRFTASEVTGTWPQAKKHTQWPGDGPKKGQKGDPIFDAFYATQVESLTSAEETQTLIQAAGTALLDKIGPAILVTHSQAGTFGWLLADRRPRAVKGIVAIEPSGPPFQNAVTSENPNRAWGITDIPLTYDPPARAASELKRVRQSTADAPGLTACWQQADPPRRLPNLRGIPIVVVTTESSNHAAYDHCTSKYLTHAGVANTLMRLEDQGIHGNGHMVMLEKNNLEVAALLQKWIAAHVP
ncbi:MAG: alpha/beta fold hydrolase [Acidobacteriia bacterium]|nr:alpha/beta fold hydrolase [Terriglobia bacterium]